MGEFIDNRNEFELEIEFSKEGIRDFMDWTIELERRDSEFKNWRVCFTKRDDIKIYSKKDGSKYNEFMPFIMGELVFNESYSMSSIIRAITEINEIRKWDFTIVNLKSTPMACPNNNVQYKEIVSAH